jgi:hypothetical protein
MSFEMPQGAADPRGKKVARGGQENPADMISGEIGGKKRSPEAPVDPQVAEKVREIENRIQGADLHLADLEREFNDNVKKYAELTKYRKGDPEMVAKYQAGFEAEDRQLEEEFRILRGSVERGALKREDYEKMYRTSYDHRDKERDPMTYKDRAKEVDREIDNFKARKDAWLKEVKDLRGE